MSRENTFTSPRSGGAFNNGGRSRGWGGTTGGSQESVVESSGSAESCGRCSRIRAAISSKCHGRKSWESTPTSIASESVSSGRGEFGSKAQSGVAWLSTQSFRDGNRHFMRQPRPRLAGIGIGSGRPSVSRRSPWGHHSKGRAGDREPAHLQRFGVVLVMGWSRVRRSGEVKA